MASAESDVEWSFGELSILLLTSPQGVVNKNDVLQIVRSVLRSQQALLAHDEEHECFYGSYAALCAHYIKSNAFHLPKSQVTSAAQACRILLQYFLQKLQCFVDQCFIENYCLSQKQIVSVIYGLCKNTDVLTRTDVPVLTAVLKLAKIPPSFAIRSSDYQEGRDELKEPKRPRLDPSATILEQLMTPVLDLHGSKQPEGPIEMVDKDGDTTIIHIPDPGLESKTLLISKNISSLQQLNGVDILLDMSLCLSSISQYVSKLQDALAGKGLQLPSSITEAVRISNMYKSMVSDMQIVNKALSLPVLEPLTEGRLEKLMRITLSCLCVSASVACTASILGLSGGPQAKGGALKDDENESLPVSIVEASLEIYNILTSTIKSSTRAGGHNLQNLHMIGAWILLTGLQYILNLNPAQLGEKSKEASTRGKATPDQTTPAKAKDPLVAPKPIILKIQQGFGVLSVALASQGITLLSSLSDDLCIEISSNLIEQPSEFLAAGTQVPFCVSDLSNLCVSADRYTAWKRVQKLTSNISLTNLLFSLASVSYRKACMLKRIQKHPVEGDAFSTSDSNTYYEDDFSSSNDSSEDTDDDSEPILGQWFEETLAPQDSSSTVPAATCASSNSDHNLVNGKSLQQQKGIDGSSLIPDRGEPNGYICLASKIFTFMNNFLVTFDSSCVKSFLKHNLGEAQMIVLAGIIKDLDRETSKIDSGSFCAYFGPVLGQLYEEFSQSLSRFMHNILATGMLADNLQNILLAQLGVSPWGQESWPLQVHCRTLSVLSQTLLLRQQREKDELRSESEASCVLIWQRLLNTLKRAILTPSAFTSTEESEDINVEHAQLLLFLFHNLHLMQKKSILLMVAQTIMEVSSSVTSPLKDLQIVYIGRLLLLFEYMMRNLYDAPPSLIEQIQKNLFSAQGTSSALEKDNTKKPSKLFFPCKEVEENYAKNLQPEETPGAATRPQFFNLMSVEFSNQEVPKLDGFACSFILSSSDVLKYPSFYYSIQNLVYLASQCDMPERVASEELTFLGLCAVQYSMMIIWRLLLCLPPSVQSLEAISTGTSALNDAECLHALIWSSRSSHKVFSGWMKDSLVKQGLTTQNAESLLRSVTKNACNVKFDIKIAKQLVAKQLCQITSSASEPWQKEQSPRLIDMMIAEAAIAKVQVALDEYFSKPLSEGCNTEARELAQEMLPIVLQSIEILSSCIRWNLLHQMADVMTSQSSPPPSIKTLQAYNSVLRMSSVGGSKVCPFTSSIADLFPQPLRTVLDTWNSYTITSTAWRNDYANDIIPSESYISSIELSHINFLSSQSTFAINPNMKRMLHTLVRFAGDLIIWCPESDSTKEMIRVMLPLLLDVTTESLVDYTTLALERLIGAPDGDEFLSFNYFEILSCSYDLLINHSNKESDVDERILHECLKFMESLLEKTAGKKAMESFFTEEGDIDMVNILLSAANSNLSPVYGTQVLKFFGRLFQQKEKNPGDKTLEKLCSSLCKMNKLGKVDSGTMQQWLSKVVFGPPIQVEEGTTVQENRLLLQTLTTHIVKQNSAVGEKVANIFLSAMIPMGSQILSPASEGIGFSELMVIMAILAGAGSGAGHIQLLGASPVWLELCKKYIAQKDVLEKLEQNISGGKHQIMMESSCYLLSYMADVVGALRYQSDKTSIMSRTGAASPPCDGDLHHPEMDSDWAEEIGPDEEESAGEDSDEDSLCNKLCTFTITQKEFMNQHWYHCHTCKMVDGVGVCTVCAKVCHKDHDVTYAKYGSFFCDCGAKEDGSCQALVKRSPKASADGGALAQPSTTFPFPSENILPSSLRRRPSSPSPAGATAAGSSSGAQASEIKKPSEESLKHKQMLAKQLESSRDLLLGYLVTHNVASTVLGLLQYLMPAVIQSCQRNSPIGSSIRAQNALLELHTQDKVLEQSDQLMVPTLGSQEGAFENVRMNYSGEQGQTIRQLISSHMIRRVAMCCLASPRGKRQHLAVSHEKGKITLLQLSALLKQADSSKRKLTLTRLASAPVPFMALSINGNPCNEDFLAVCGLKDCHILNFNASGSVSDHVVLHPQLESGNYIVKAIWLPGSQTELALVTADMIKIYDLAHDSLSPQFFFLLPSEKIRDCCFVFSEDSQRHLLVMSSAGHIYYQPMAEDSSAKHGPFYVTNIMETKHSELKDSNGTVCGGGVSIYYSHTLQLLFFSFTQGKSFVAPLSRISSQLSQLFLIQMKASNNGNSSGNSKPTPQPLCQWSEVANHPGLVLAQMQSSNNPVILMVKPDTIYVQEIKFLTAKSKITDMVAIRHIITCGELRTTLILLCEDGSLRIYMANQEQTGYWLTPAFQPASHQNASKPARKKKAAKTGRPPGSVTFPVDFFEHCTALGDIDFGGNDLLHLYNSAQVKHRLNTTGLYVVCQKATGFTIEVTNNDNTMVMVGVRILLGSQDVQRAPSCIEIFGRSVQVTLTRNRWYDFPFSREESLNCDKKLSIFFGPSSDSSSIMMVDSIKVYGRTKEAFGWPEDCEDFSNQPATTTNPGTATQEAGVELDGISTTPLPLTSLDRLIGSSLELLDGYFAVGLNSDEKSALRTTAIDLATQMLTLPTAPVIHDHVKSLLFTLYNNKTTYSSHKDDALLNYVVHCLYTSQDGKPLEELDGEAFYRLVLITRGVAIARPANLVRFAENLDLTLLPEASDPGSSETLDSTSEASGLSIGEKHKSSSSLGSPQRPADGSGCSHFINQLSDAFWHLHALQPKNPAVAPVSYRGLVHVEVTVHALVEIFHAFAACDLEHVHLTAKLYVKLLLSSDPVVSFAAKQSLIRVLRPRVRRRKVFIPSPPHCSSPGEIHESDSNESRMPQPQAPPQAAPPPPSQAQAQVRLAAEVAEFHQDLEQFEIVDGLDPLVLLPADGAGGIPNIEALIAGQGGFPLLDIPPDDDETMVELAIALSLQDQPERSGAFNLQGLSLSSQGSQHASSLEGGHYSDTTASAGASDDEGSTAATDGSTLRTSPAEQGGSAGSESGGSGVESIMGEHNVSGRSSAYGDNVPESITTGARSETSSVGLPSSSMPQEGEGLDIEADVDTSLRLHSLRLALLEKMLQYLPELREVGGVRSVPYMQVILMLTSDLVGEEEKDRAALDTLLTAIVSEMELNCRDISKISERTPAREVNLIIMRLLSIMMSRVRSAGKTSLNESSTFCSTATATALISTNTIDTCLQTLKVLLDYWRTVQSEDKSSTVAGNLLKSHPPSPPPDMSPFFLKQYVKGHASDVFEAYPQLLTEMVLRLPYQIKKILSSLPNAQPVVFSQSWFICLCEYMMMQQTPFVRRQVRKLLLFICGSKEKYRQLRDFHSLESHLKDVKTICEQGGFDIQLSNSTIICLSYDCLITMIEHLKACSEIATSRTTNWQKFCLKDESILSFLIHVSFLLDEGVSPIILQLLQCALCGAKGMQQQQQQQQAITINPQATSSPAKQRKEKEKTDADEETEETNKSDIAHCIALAQQVNKFVDKNLLSQFVQSFLLESNSTAVRFQAHGLIHHFYKNSNTAQQEVLLDLMWKLWPQLPAYGRKAAQFVDLVGWFTLHMPSSDARSKSYVEKALEMLHQQNQLLMNHPNSNIYNSLQGLVEFDGYYLESEPCLVCNNPEVPYTNIKLSAIKVDSRFTTTTQIVKLIGSHTISKITLRIGDLKRNKMVHTLNIYYNNRSVQSVVELKNKPSIWHKAKKCTLAAGQTELKIEFPLPIVACNLMIEYADFYENIQASSETLQCPRCSASVPANPGVCSNCGENVFQCHKCRAINYDEKDPFLCNSCGFCKYAKFDYTITAKPCCAVDPIENEEDRKKAISSINSLLEKADRVYKQLIGNKPALETLLLRIYEHGLLEKGLDDPAVTTTTSTTAVSSTNVNRAIQQLAQRYCSDCKASFDELSKIVQKVLASRKELVDYERRQREIQIKESPSAAQRMSDASLPTLRQVPEKLKQQSATNAAFSKCYGCASSTVEHCITLLRALSTSTQYQHILCSQGLIRELVAYNLRHGSVQVRQEVRLLLCLLTLNNPRATADLNDLLTRKIMATLKGPLTSPDMAASVRHEVALLANSLQKSDTCWEQRVRCAMILFTAGYRAKSSVVMESLTLPCLKMLQQVIKPTFLSKAHKDKNVEDLATKGILAGMKLGVELKGWVLEDEELSFKYWAKQAPPKVADQTTVNVSKMKREEVHARFLMEKYSSLWKEKTRRPMWSMEIIQPNWMHRVIFNHSSQAARTMACSLVETMCQYPSCRRNVLDVLTTYLDHLGTAGESAAEFLALYQNLIHPTPWKYYLALRGLLPHIGDLITREIEYLGYLEETTLNSDLSQGYALKMLTELLESFIEVDIIRQHYKSRLVGCVLNGYLSLRKLVVQRTKLIDETQEKLLELLEEMTTGTESETKAFMAVCVETVKKYGLDDLRTPVFIFERLCSVIYPEESDSAEFFITLEKDPQQEDFLQGRMLGNPYSSNEPGMGPLMRDIKNKICQDCELVALLEDDSGMELLVNNKIINLDLPVKDVYRKVWCSENNESEAMRIVYRMRGLLGDATEEFIENLDTKDNEEVDNEEVYKIANVMSQCGGLEVMLERMATITDLSRGRSLLTILLKLFGFCIKVKNNREKLIEPQMGTIRVMLGVLHLALSTDSTELLQGLAGGVTEQLLQIMETVLVEAASGNTAQYVEFCTSCGTKEDITFLLASVNNMAIKNNTSLLQLLMRVVPFLSYGSQEKMESLIDHFKPYLNFNAFDFDHTSEEDLQLECFCMLTAGIECNVHGALLKDLMVKKRIVCDALLYITAHAPPIKSALLGASEEWKEFTSKPALKYVLKLLTGLSQGHETTQHLVSAECIPIIHRLEQVSSDERVGSLAENLMEAIKKNPSVAQKIEEVRKQTKDEKKRLAMAMREKQLGALGMSTNEKGQVTAKSSLLKNVEELGEESGLVCIICREGYKFQPTKVLGIYTFTKRCHAEDFENRPRKTPGYSTVTHFNVVHVDCHMAAVRHARGRDEWESAALQNANTKCNGLLPLWGPQVPESAFASCLARHNTYLQECTGHRDVGYSSTVHDIKLLLQKFAFEKSFSEDSGGGGPQSNMHLIPYLVHMALYVINTTRFVSSEEKNIVNFLDLPSVKWVENCYEVEGPLYWMTMCVVVFPKPKWQKLRLRFLKRVLIMAQTRHSSPQSVTTLSDTNTLEFPVYKPYLLFFGLVDGLFKRMLKKVSVSENEEWSVVLAEYVRHNDQPLLEAGDNLLRFFEDDLVPVQSFSEFCDVADLLQEVTEPDNFLQETLHFAEARQF